MAQILTTPGALPTEVTTSSCQCLLLSNVEYLCDCGLVLGISLPGLTWSSGFLIVHNGSKLASKNELPAVNKVPEHRRQDHSI